jgi:hypothetical protein
MAGAGVGEAALLGAAMGGGSAMLAGRDPLQGAIMGTLTGGAGAGISGLLPGATAATTVLPQIAPAVAPTVATETAVASTLAPEIAKSGITTLASNLPTSISNSVLSQIAPNAIMPSAVPAAVTAAPVTAASNVIPTPLQSFPAQDLIARVPNFESNLIARVPGNIPVQSTLESTVPELTREKLAELTTQNDALARTAAQYPQAPAAPSTFMEGMGKFAKDPIASIMSNKPTAFASALAGASAKKKKEEEEEKYSGPLSRFKYNPDAYRPSGYADGGITSLSGYDRMVGEQPMYMSDMARGGIADLGGYSDGGRMLKGPGDGMSDNIPATIAGKRPARLADGEFVIPADVVSHLGNGSSDAGAKQLYAMMAKVRKARTGRKAQGREINPRQYMAA